MKLQLLLAFLTTSRYEGPEYDETLVEEDAKALNKAARKFGLAGKTFIQIFSDRSRAHLCAVSDIYKTMFKKTLEKVNFYPHIIIFSIELVFHVPISI